MFYIENSNITLFGNPVTYYAVMPVLAAVVITLLGCGFAWLKKQDVSFMFRLCIITYSVGAISYLYMDGVPTILQPFMTLLGNVAVMLVFGMCAKIFHKDEIQLLSFGAFSYIVLFVFVKIGCFLTGCCYGNPYEGVFSVSYGVHTMNPCKGDSLLAVQLITAIFYLILTVVGFIMICKKDSVNVAVFILFSNNFVYYVTKFLCADRANQAMMAGGVNWIKIMSIVTFLGMSVFFIKIMKGDNKE